MPSTSPYLVNIWLNYWNNNKKNKQTKCTYSPLGKAFEKQIKTIED